MQTTSCTKAGLLALGLVVVFIIIWELFWRSQGFGVSYNDDESLWAHTHKKIYHSSPTRPVVIGSSRIKFDLDLDTWESIAGKKPIQLSLEGTSPRPVLTDLANDTAFKGTVLVGITEALFFQPSPNPYEIQANKRLGFYPHWSISSQISFRINKVMESCLVFLQENTFALNALLKRLPIESRPGVFVFPNFPMKFTYTRFDRQTYMTPDFVKDTSMQHQMQNIWNNLVINGPPLPRPKGVVVDKAKELAKVIEEVKESVNKIRNRGGQVVFLREPSSGVFLEFEKKAFPRQTYWDKLLEETKAPGIHFTDYPTLSQFTCPEWSHLKPEDAVTYTKNLIPILEEKTGWKIKK